MARLGGRIGRVRFGSRVGFGRRHGSFLSGYRHRSQILLIGLYYVEARRLRSLRNFFIDWRLGYGRFYYSGWSICYCWCFGHLGGGSWCRYYGGGGRYYDFYPEKLGSGESTFLGLEVIATRPCEEYVPGSSIGWDSVTLRYSYARFFEREETIELPVAMSLEC